ncbi:uncharacterized protein LOC108858828 [Raphanus sativus]|uniref:Uncharacterized protein LOC108858828 n=1 Tax=Raphanus sativus TaxID=3726 RepID=A0A6J0NWS8_RAPSA|nr:uncharacterized protein LOC108858828 [Raphanus sativus]
MKSVIFISFLLLLQLCSSGSEEDHGVTHTDQYSKEKIEESIETLMDYPKPGPNDPGSGHRFRTPPGRPPHPMSNP